MHNNIYKIFLIIILISFTQSCGRNCTEMYCECERPAIYILIEKHEYKDEPIDFNKEELEQFYLLFSATINNEIIDSISIRFSYLASQEGHYYYYNINEHSLGYELGFNIDLRQYSLYIKNNKIDFSDTISDIYYFNKDTTFICNRCSRPPHDYITCAKAKDFRFQFNHQNHNLESTSLVERAIILRK